MSPHIVQTFFCPALYGTKSQTVKIFLAILEVRRDQGDIKTELYPTQPSTPPRCPKSSLPRAWTCWAKLLEIQKRPALMRTTPLHDSVCSACEYCAGSEIGAPIQEQPRRSGTAGSGFMPSFTASLAIRRRCLSTNPRGT